MCITPDKKYLAAAGRHVVRLYDIKSSNPNPIMVFEGHHNNVTAVAFHVDTKWMVTSSEDSTVKVWDTRTGTVQRNYQHTHPVNDVVIHPNQGEIISADRGGNVRVYDLGSNKCTHQLIPAEDVSVSSVSVANDGSILAAGNNLVGLLLDQGRTFTDLLYRAMFTSGACFKTTKRLLLLLAVFSLLTRIISLAYSCHLISSFWLHAHQTTPSRYGA